MCVALARLLGGAGEELAGAGDVAGLLVVLGGGAEKVARARARPAGQPRGGFGVQGLARALEQRVVGHLMQDLVPERVLAHVVEARVLVRQSKFTPHQGRQRLRCGRVEGGERVVPEHQADHAGLLQREPLGAGQAVQAGLQHAGQGGRHRRGHEARRMQRPVLCAGLDRALVDQHLDQLFHVERVAFRAADDQLAQRGRHFGQLLQQLVGELLAVALVERHQVDAQVRRAAGDALGTALEQRRARQAQHQQRHIAVDVGQVGQELERSVVGPVQVVELQQQRRRLARADPPQHLRGGVEGAGADLLRVVEDALHVPAVAEVEADQMPEQVGVRLRQVGPVVGDEERHQALLELVLGHPHAVAVADLQVPGQHVAQQAERAALRLRVGAALEARGRRRERREPALELVQQPALADARVGHHRDGGVAAIGIQPFDRSLQRLQFRVAADHAGLDAFDPARAAAQAARLGPHDEVGDDRLAHALDHQRRLRLDLEHAAHQVVGVVADAHAAGRCGLFHAGGDIDRHAADRRLGIDPAAEQHAAGVDTHPHVHAGVAVLALDLLAECASLGQQGQPAAHAALGVVFARSIGAEHRQQVVARVLQHPATMPADDGGAARQRAVHHARDLLRVEALAQRGRADDVEKEDRDLLQLGCRGAGRCECGRRGQPREPFAQRRQRDLDHRVAEQTALRLQRGNAGLQLFQLGCHGTRG